MGEYTNVLLDYEGGIEILFSRPPGTTFSYSNDVIEYVRRRDVKTVPHVSSAGVREISFQMETAASPTLERQLDYFRRSGKSLLLFLPLSNFASEIIIKDVELTEQVQTTQTYTISAYCFGVEGMSVLVTDSIILGQTGTTADADALGGYASRLYEIGSDTSYFEIVTGNFYMPAGTYYTIVRAKASATVTNDLNIGIQDLTAAEYFANGLKTPTSSYTYYIAQGAADSANMDHSVLLYAHKDTATTNNIYVNMLAYVQASGLITV